MARVRHESETVGQAILELLRDRGIDCVFGNASTSIIDGFARLAARGEAAPRPVMVSHEQVAVAMAHGYFAVTGRLQAAIVYSTVGTANALGAIINASRARIPMLILAARSAIVDEGGATGVRDIHVQWAQESVDQGSMVREWVKWDYELRDATQVESAIDRAIELAMDEPCGPVYLTLPRDVIARTIDGFEFESPSRRRTVARRWPDPSQIEAAAEILASAQRPLIVTSELGRNCAARNALLELSEAGAIGVLEASPVYSNFPAEHPCHLGYVFGSQTHHAVGEADAIVVVESDVPWFPARVRLADKLRVVHLGVDPRFGRYPMRNFPCDIPIVAEPVLALPLLAGALRSRIDEGTVERRMAAHRQRHAHERESWARAAESERDREPIGFQWASRCIADIVDDNTIVVNEYPLDLRHAPARHAETYLGPSHSGGLGWGFGAAIGAKAGAPGKTVIATLGDGSYYFSVPTACHQVSRSQRLPVLVLLFDNARWEEVVKSTLNVHPQGWAARTGHVPMTSLEPSPAFADLARAFGGHGERVEIPRDLPGALRRALAVVRDERRQALVHIVCSR